MTPQADPDQATLLLTIDVLDDTTGMAEVEDDQGRNFELPAAWLPDAAEGRAYRALPTPGGVTFVPLAGGARELRERSKQTLLEFSDEHDEDAPSPTPPPRRSEA
ncbi:hypothetical protein [Deinococcus aquiradiocola]|uniref:Uncharacterized protein n=1 Tax=Deinococcus aquiradiocola TaxID=393059 RepID=A0A917URC4_9DEIO|nr:hypothetical protein [Deinococcus aquiradiocola]GGJ79917.1 hypothetical protein GCM10008939_24750 [Deinococcus aquiradiocola]